MLNSANSVANGAWTYIIKIKNCAKMIILEGLYFNLDNGKSTRFLVDNPSTRELAFMRLSDLGALI